MQSKIIIAALAGAASLALPSVAAVGPTLKTKAITGFSTSSGTLSRTSTNGTNSTSRSFSVYFNRFSGGILAKADVALGVSTKTDIAVTGATDRMEGRARTTGSVGIGNATFALPTAANEVRCTTGADGTCSASTGTINNNFTRAITGGLGDLYGSGSASSFGMIYSEINPGYSSTPGSSAGSQTVTSSFTVTNLSGTYSYYDFANAAFGTDGSKTLTLDFGDIVRGTSVAAQAFNIHNIAAAGAVSLDLDKVVNSLAGSPFTLAAPTFKAGIDAGASKAYSVGLNTSKAGQFEDTYTFTLSDQDLGYGMRNYTLTLKLLGNVTEAPEPASWAMMLLGFGAIGGALRGSRRGARTTIFS